MKQTTETEQGYRNETKHDVRVTAHTAERDYRNRMADNIADTAYSALFSRDESSGLGGVSQQSLKAYSEWGEVFNPSEGEFADKLRRDVRIRFREETAHIPLSEIEIVAKIYPDIIRAIALDRRYVERVYEKDFQAIFETALDWTLHPESISETYLRIGFGGEENVGSRVPAYVVTGITMQERIRNAFRVHGNWAIHSEMHNMLSEDDGRKLDGWLGREIKGLKGEEEPSDDYDPSDDLDEAIIKGQVSPKEVRNLLISAWQKFLKSDCPMDDLEEKYHFTDNIPKLVVFNASHAAINIDRMSKDKVLGSRDQTQRFIKNYVKTFHPDLEDSLLFQNDLPWSEHDLPTRMAVWYAHDIISSVDGKRERTRERLHQFGQHHKRDSYGSIYGIEPSDLYGDMHPFFFQDPIERANGVKDQFFVEPKIMEPLEKDGAKQVSNARHIIFLQGRPEDTFGVYRKLFSEMANMNDFVNWLESRKGALVYRFDEIAIQIGTEAERIFAQTKSKGQERDFHSCLAQTVKVIFKPTKPVEGEDQQESTNNDRSAAARRFFLTFIGSDGFKESKDQKQAWEEFTSQLQARIPKPSEDEDQQLAIDREVGEIEIYIKQLNFHRELLAKYQRNRDAAFQSVSVDKIKELAGLAEAEVLQYPMSKVEIGVTVGELPVYYIQKGSDSQIWPNTEHASLKRYNHALETASQRMDRLKVISKFAKKLVKSKLTYEEAEKIKSGLSFEENVAALSSIYEDVGRMMKDGVEEKEIDEFLKTNLSSIVDRKAEEIAENKGIGAQQAKENYQLDAVIVELTNEKVLKDTNADIVKATAARSDYLAILADINPDIYILAKQEMELVKRLQKEKQGKAELEEQLKNIRVQINEALVTAEQRYNNLIVSTFPSSNGHNGKNNHEEIVVFNASQITPAQN